MKLPLYQVDAFTYQVFGGNPAAVIPLGGQWLADELLQKIANENNLSETAFFITLNGEFHIRWFTPQVEVDLCGHATLATAFVLKNYLNYTKPKITFSSRSGKLGISFKEDWIILDFPQSKVKKWITDNMLIEALGVEPLSCHKSNDDWLVELSSEKDVRDLQPDFNLLKNIDCRGVICTAPSSDPQVDFVSRFFAPNVGIDEDPVTGSAHTKLIPFWSNKLKKSELVALQVSKRGGILKCSLKNSRVQIGGRAVPYLVGEINI